LPHPILLNKTTATAVTATLDSANGNITFQPKRIS